MPGWIPQAWQRRFPNAWQTWLPPGDWRWTLNEGMVCITPGRGQCPICLQTATTWKWEKGIWVGTDCHETVPVTVDPALVQWVAWIQAHMDHLWPNCGAPEAWGNIHAYSLRARYAPPGWDPAHFRRWRDLGYLVVHHPPRFTYWDSTLKHRAVRIHPLWWERANAVLGSWIPP